MSEIEPIKITTRDRLLRSWLNSTEMVRDYQKYSQETKDDNAVAELFSKYAEYEAVHASKLLELLHEYDS